MIMKHAGAEGFGNFNHLVSFNKTSETELV